MNELLEQAQHTLGVCGELKLWRLRVPVDWRNGGNQISTCGTQVSPNALPVQTAAWSCESAPPWRQRQSPSGNPGRRYEWDGFK